MLHGHVPANTRKKRARFQALWLWASRLTLGISAPRLESRRAVLPGLSLVPWDFRALGGRGRKVHPQPHTASWPEQGVAGTQVILRWLAVRNPIPFIAGATSLILARPGSGSIIWVIYARFLGSCFLLLIQPWGLPSVQGAGLWG